MAGLTLIELVFFIVIVSVAVAGVLSVLNVTARRSADPQLRKQAIAIAEALLEEVETMPFTYCDPDDPNAGTANSSDDCSAGNNEASLPLGAQANAASEMRGSLDTPFDNVADYNGFTIQGGNAGSADIGGVVSVPAGYNASVAVAQEAFGPTGVPSPQVPAVAALRITVTVTYNGGSDSIVMEGYRAQYAPRATP
ncbi:hypothetical protein TSA66_18050 [Noviherbaspirillum autotrophicum]|uniref:MSHA biogenesis protein MshD n=2 Tax=Noviherbaspirillum autotrophicum TaxID=709839 RepID=A0A0C1YA12_9BURK|nr:hypothetical protein TSA66_18050 [Noviherbaspirillum autotrophicum]